MDLSVITVTWNSKEHIGRQIQSVFSGSLKNSFEHIVIDNASTDGTAEYIRKKYPCVQLIANEKNKGFAAANNQGVKLAQSEFILFLNPDMVVEPGSLDTILDWMRNNKKVGIASPKLVDEQGNLNEHALPRRFPRVWEQVALILKLPHLFPFLLNKYLMKGFDGEKEQEVDSVRGSFMIVRRELIEKLGFGFDPRYFIWFEDVDICREAKKHGYNVMYTSVITATDFVGQSFKKRDSVWKQKNFTKSMLTYFQKWEPWYKWMWIALVRPIGIGMTYLMNLGRK